MYKQNSISSSKEDYDRIVIIQFFHNYCTCNAIATKIKDYCDFDRLVSVSILRTSVISSVYHSKPKSVVN